MTAERAKQPLVEILYFDGCPHHEQTTSRVERVAAELGLRPEIRLVKVADAEAAARQRFLGSPTVRVNGEDVELEVERALNVLDAKHRNNGSLVRRHLVRSARPRARGRA